MKVVFNHEFMQWARVVTAGNGVMDLDKLIRRDARLGTTHFDAPGAHGWGYAGSCLPKDTKAIAADAKGSLPLIEDVVKRNETLRSQNNRA